MSLSAYALQAARAVLVAADGPNGADSWTTTGNLIISDAALASAYLSNNIPF